MNRKVVIARLLGGVGMAFSATSVCAQAPAQSSGASTAGASVGAADIVVTAQRREESLSKTPVAVAVLSADTLAKAQIVSEQDLRSATPGLTVRSGLSSNQLNFSLRGQSQDAFSNSRPGVLPYINEIQIGGAGGATAFYDLQSIQVLKGPQGTLFGRSATGGAVLYTTAKPTDKLGGYISGLYGNYDAFKVEGALNVPLVDDRLMARVAGFYQSRNGMQRNLFYNNRREGDFERYGVRGSLTAQMGALRNELVVDYFRASGSSMQGVLASLLPLSPIPGNPPFVPASILYGGTDPAARAAAIATLSAFTGAPAAAAAGFYDAYFSDPRLPRGGLAGALAEQNARGPYVVNNDAVNIHRQKNTIVTNTSTLELGDSISLKNIFGYTNLRSFDRFESDGTPFNLSGNGRPGQPGGQAAFTRQVSDELQLLGTTLGDRLDYVTGVYFSSERVEQNQAGIYFDIFFGGAPSNPSYIIKNKTYAAYAQGTYHLNDNGLAIQLGVRYTDEKVTKITQPDDTVRLILGDPAPPGYSYNKSASFKKVSWLIGIQDQISPELLVYLTSRRAYKSGGFNGAVGALNGFAEVAGDGYRAERVTDAELGTKFQGRIGDVPVRANVAMFYNWVQNSQRAAYTFVQGQPAGLTVNVPQGRIYGIEFDAQISPTDWLTLGGSANYTHSRFGADPVFVNGQRQIFNQVPDTPKFSGSAFAEISQPLTGDLVGTLHGDIYTQSKSFTFPQSSNNAGTILPSYTLANFRVGVQDGRAGWSLTANLKNAFNKIYYTGSLPTGQIYQANVRVPGDRRTYTLEARFNF